MTDQSTSEGRHPLECTACGHRYEVPSHRRTCPPDCPSCGRNIMDLYGGTREARPEGDKDEMCAEHWLLEGVRDGSCADCLGAVIPDGKGAVIVTEDANSDSVGVTFAGVVGDIPFGATLLLGRLAGPVAASGLEPGTVVATFAPGDIESLKLEVGLESEGQQTLGGFA